MVGPFLMVLISDDSVELGFGIIAKATIILYNIKRK